MDYNPIEELRKLQVAHGTNNVRWEIARRQASCLKLLDEEGMTRLCLKGLPSVSSTPEGWYRDLAMHIIPNPSRAKETIDSLASDLVTGRQPVSYNP